MEEDIKPTREQEITSLKEELGREYTDEDRAIFKDQYIAKLREAYLKARPDAGGIRDGSVTRARIDEYNKEVADLNALGSSEIDWRIRRDIRDRIEDLESQK